MADVDPLPHDALRFLTPYLPPDTASARDDASTTPRLPFVTLTYAASLDSMIALAPGARTTLSGPETASLTHYLRLRHDAIVVGANTAAVDDPGLNCRYPDATIRDQPRPVIVDPNGRWNGRGTKAYRLAAEGVAEPPWLITTSRTVETKAGLHDVGGDYVVVDEHDAAGAISWVAILRTLGARGIRSVMVEGGATVINALLVQPTLVDAVIITIAPTFVGQGGVAVSPAARNAAAGGERTNAVSLAEPAWKQFGTDVVLAAYLRA